ncbi:hypothetical protein HGRIS_000890 [Hohenbuehelia grisea]|uniref:Carboxylic ester hydrolase n=1 Tax=Hohenbuehelia grisea TaxID=104357 RepID=A0ABR3IQ18_9AGAR
MYSATWPTTLAALALCSIHVARAESVDPSSVPVVNLGYAKYQGVFDRSTNVTSYLGMSFAAPPLGDLRWREPQAPRQTNGVQQADTEPPSCLQVPAFGNSPVNPLCNGTNVSSTPVTISDGVAVESEDCLFLDVFFPGPEVPRKKLPVVVHIHGGGYILGNVSVQSGLDLVVDADHGVVSVLMQYRLGFFGFLAGKEVKRNGALNAGLLDQEFALKWVQKHIDKFGGDPSKVTIYGESAGAGSVIQHIVAHGGRTNPPLFRAAITGSTFLPSQYKYDDTVPEALYKAFVSQSGCSSAVDTLACLRTTDISILQDANHNITLTGYFGTFTSSPVIDGTFITRSPVEILQRGVFNGRQLLSSVTSHEGDFFVDQNQTLTVKEYALNLFPQFSDRDGSDVERTYSGLGNSVEQINLIYGECRWHITLWVDVSYRR